MTKLLDKRAQLVTFHIIAPRYRDKTVLLSKIRVDQPRAKRKVQDLKIVLESNHMQGEWYLSRTVAKRHKVESNGVIDTYVVPLHKLERFKLTERSHHEW